MKKISIVTPCYNEKGNIKALTDRVREIMSELDYEYEHLIIDNCSTDESWDIICECSKTDPHIKGIHNARNFGPLRSLSYGLFQADGDAVISVACDFQDPPELIKDFVSEWEKGFKVVLGQKNKSDEGLIMRACRSLYYYIINKLSDIKQFKQTTGFGLYDRSVIEVIKQINEPEPSIRHIIAELGYKVSFVKYSQPKRKSGKSSFNFNSYADYAFNTMINTSVVPLKLAVILGLITSFISFGIGIAYLVWKLINWNYFDTGMAPILIGLFFIGGVLLMFVGVIGEYVGEILKRIKTRPLVIEEERIGFSDKEKEDK